MGGLFSRPHRISEARVRLGKSEGRGQGVFLTADADAGALLCSEPPLLALASDPMLCAGCGRVAGSLPQLLHAHAEALERSSGERLLVSNGERLPAAGSAEHACNCKCGQMYCSDACRAKDLPVHALLCTSDADSADGEYAARLAELIDCGSELSPCLPLSVRAVVKLVADTLTSHGNFETARLELEQATGPLSEFGTTRGPRDRIMDSNCTTHDDATQIYDPADSDIQERSSECSADDVEKGMYEPSTSNETRELDGERVEHDDEGLLLANLYTSVWHALLEHILRRAFLGGANSNFSNHNPADATHVLTSLKGLGPEWFIALCTAVERRAIPIVVPHPLQRHIENLVNSTADTASAGKMSTEYMHLLCAILERSVEDTAAQLTGSSDGDLTSSRSKRARRSSQEAGLTHLQALYAGAEGADVFPPFVGMALTPIACMANHSCEPNCRVRFRDSRGANDAAHIDGGWERCELLAECPLRCGDEVLISYVGPTLPLHERRAHLRTVFGFHCECDKCELEEHINTTHALLDTASTVSGNARTLGSEGDPQADVSDLHDLASRALSAGLASQAAQLFRLILTTPMVVGKQERRAPATLGGSNRHPPDANAENGQSTGRTCSFGGDGLGGLVDGDAHLGLGGALLRMRDFGGARNAWREGARLCPTHKGLQREVETIESYCNEGGEEDGELGYHDNGPEHGKRVVRSSAASGTSGCVLPTTRTHLVSRGRCACETSQPLFSLAECSALVAASEAHATSCGGWSTSRHSHVPTTDLEVHAVKPVLKWFNRACREQLFPLVAMAFSHLNVSAERLRVSDAFVVRYDADGGQASLPPHADNAHFSLTIALNPRSDFHGGGTRFEATGLVLSPDVGHVVCFPGSLRHAGHPITHGRRYIIAAFLWVEGFHEPATWTED